MSDKEELLLRWNSFNSNLSTGFHESLCQGDLVDVTLAAEGQLVKAHRLVLSVCSPYFRQMFTQMPANQHAIIFLKDVSHGALVDLIQFMYCGEVNVKEDALPTLISIAEALQIKGLAEPTASITTTSPRSQINRSFSRKSSNSKSKESSDGEPVPIITQKRPTSSCIEPIFAPALKRIKNNDPLEASEPISHQQITTTIETNSNAEETKFIKMPMEPMTMESMPMESMPMESMPMESMSIKSEPYYGEDDTDEAEAADQNTVYFIDDSDDNDSNYFEENETSEFTEPIGESGDQLTKEIQYDNMQNCVNGIIRYATTKRGRKMLCIDGYYFVQNSQSKFNIFWRCPRYDKLGCRATAVTSKSPNDLLVRLTGDAHSHDFEETMDVLNDPLDTSRLTYKFMKNYKVEKAAPCEFKEQYAETVDEAQTENIHKFEDGITRFTTTQRGNPKLYYNGYIFMAHRFNKTTTYWRCSKYKQFGCKAALTSSRSQNVSSIRPRGYPHSHGIEKPKKHLS